MQTWFRFPGDQTPVVAPSRGKWWSDTQVNLIGKWPGRGVVWWAQESVGGCLSRARVVLSVRAAQHESAMGPELVRGLAGAALGRGRAWHSSLCRVSVLAS